MPSSQPQRSTLVSLARKSHILNRRVETLESVEADLLASSALLEVQGTGVQEITSEIAMLARIQEGDQHALLLASANSADIPLSTELSTDPRLLLEDGWLLEFQSTRGFPTPPTKFTSAIDWAPDTVGMQRLLYGAIDHTGVAKLLSVEVNGHIYTSQFNEKRAAVIFIKATLASDGKYLGSRAVLDSTGTIMSGERFEYTNL